MEFLYPVAREMKSLTSGVGAVQQRRVIRVGIVIGCVANEAELIRLAVKEVFNFPIDFRIRHGLCVSEAPHTVLSSGDV